MTTLANGLLKAALRYEGILDHAKARPARLARSFSDPLPLSHRPAVKIRYTDRFPRRMDQGTVHADRKTVRLDQKSVGIDRKLIPTNRKKIRMGSENGPDRSKISPDRSEQRPFGSEIETIGFEKKPDG
jgi:hypothetical protein